MERIAHFMRALTPLVWLLWSWAWADDGTHDDSAARIAVSTAASSAAAAAAAACGGGGDNDADHARTAAAVPSGAWARCHVALRAPCNSTLDFVAKCAA